MFDILATDYDGTLAVHGNVAPETIDALGRWRASGRRIVLVTGRQLGDLLARFPHAELCDRIVAENGAVLFDPAHGVTRLLGEPPEEELVTSLAARGVTPLSVGSVIVATREPHGSTVRSVLDELRSEREVVLNKGAVMLLPRGVGKASGLRAALAELGASPDRTIGFGDAENDVDMLRACGRSVAVADALPEVKAAADEVSVGESGVGVAEVVDRLLSSPRDRLTD